MKPSTGESTSANVWGDLSTEYYQKASSILDTVVSSQLVQIREAAALTFRAVAAGKRVLVFGSGHSAIMGMEAHYRAGGLAAVTPVFVPELMVHLGAIESTRLEKQSGIGSDILDPYQPESGDVLIVFSTSGINNAPVEVALAARRFGMGVVAVLSLEYSNELKPRPGIPKLAEVADVVLDNGAPAGDAVVEVPGTELRCGPVSTLTGAMLLNMVLVSVVGMTVAAGGNAGVYRSANMPGGTEHNDALAKRYLAGNPHL